MAYLSDMNYLVCSARSKKAGKPKPEFCKLSVVGDPGCGKTSLIFRFTRGRLPGTEEAAASTLETDAVEIKRNGKKIFLSVHDTPGSEDLARIRALTYNQVDGVMICFSLDSQESLLRVLTEWAPEVRHLCKGLPYVLVGTKKDLRDGANRCVQKSGTVRRFLLKNEEQTGPVVDNTHKQGDNFEKEVKRGVSKREGRQTAKKMGAVAYFECSALDENGLASVKRAFGRAVRESLKHSRGK